MIFSSMQWADWIWQSFDNYSREQEHVSVSNTPKDFQALYEGEIWSLCTVTFGQKSPNLQLYSIYIYIYSHELSYISDTTCFMPLWELSGNWPEICSVFSFSEKSKQIEPYR